MGLSERQRRAFLMANFSVGKDFPAIFCFSPGTCLKYDKAQTEKIYNACSGSEQCRANVSNISSLIVIVFFIFIHSPSQRQSVLRRDYDIICKCHSESSLFHCGCCEQIQRSLSAHFIPEQSERSFPEGQAIICSQHAEVGSFHIRIGSLREGKSGYC